MLCIFSQNQFDHVEALRRYFGGSRSRKQLLCWGSGEERNFVFLKFRGSKKLCFGGPKGNVFFQLEIYSIIFVS